jgi:DNA-binding response OmpR family regulator
MDGYIAKPFRAMELLEAIETLSGSAMESEEGRSDGQE